MRAVNVSTGYILFRYGAILLCIYAPFAHKLLVRALFRHRTVRDYDYIVGGADSVQPVGDDYERLTFDKFGYGLLDISFVVHIHAGGGFIQDDYGGVFEYATGDGYALFFSAGKEGSALAYHRIEALRQTGDKVVAARFFRGFFHLPPARARLAHGDIVEYGVLEKIYSLEHHTYIIRQAGKGQISYIRAAQFYAAFAHVPAKSVHIHSLWHTFRGSSPAALSITLRSAATHSLYYKTA